MKVSSACYHFGRNYPKFIRIPNSRIFMKNGGLDTPSVAGIAVFSSLALVLAAASQALGLNYPLIPYLQFDVGEVAIVLAFFVFGPVPALASSLVEFGGLMVFGQQIPIGPLLKLFALVSTVAGLWVGTTLASRIAESGLGRLLGAGAMVGAVFRAVVMTLPNYYLIVFLYGLAGIEGFLKVPFSLAGIGLTDANALGLILLFTGVFNVLQLLVVTSISYFVLRFPAVSQMKVGGKAPWFVSVLKGDAGRATDSIR